MRFLDWVSVVSGLVATGISLNNPAVADEPPIPGVPVETVPPAHQFVEIKPLPLPPIPDDPPPHEGALIDIPYVIEPPDLLVVEVLEALPGRPITGERLVRPDGTISLSFYGDVHVRGLNLKQAKAKIVEHLKTYLDDVVLGLSCVSSLSPLEESKRPLTPLPLPELPGNGLVDPRPEKSPPPPKDSRPGLQSRGRSTTKRVTTRSIEPLVRLTKLTEQENQARPISLSDGGDVKITIEVQSKTSQPAANETPRGESPPGPKAEELVPVSPEDTSRVFVDVTNYNSKFYYVQGDVATPGRIPCTGSDTVLDAINHGGGLIAVADPRNIRLIRPARGGSPAKIYPIDLRAIIEEGESRLNYQLFPGDRVVVGRNELIQSTIHVDRLAAEYQTLVNSMLQASFMTRSFIQATPDLSPAQREALMKEWFDLWWKASNQPGGPAADESTFRKLILRQLEAPERPTAGAEKK
jgi:protein involved in polysaccharide export with SLBB domain